MLEMQAQIEELTRHVRADMARSGDQGGQTEALVRASSSHLAPLDLF
jgi:hypothetical protein